MRCEWLPEYGQDSAEWTRLQAIAVRRADAHHAAHVQPSRIGEDDVRDLVAHLWAVTGNA